MTSAGPPWAPDSAPSDAPPAPRVHRVRFTGSAREYFRIWLVNTLLIVATLGAYAPWAKVRKRRWLYGHTWVGAANFDYHALPAQILRGRLIALAALAAYSGLGFLAPAVAVAVLVAALVLAPWFVLRAQAFAAANTSYRHLRFHFSGRYLDALRAIGPLAAWPLAVFFMPGDDAQLSVQLALVLIAPSVLLALLHPYMLAWRWRLRLGGLAWGSARFACDLRVRRFYAAYVLATIELAVAGVAFAILFGGLGFLLRGQSLPRGWLLALAGVGFGAIATVPITRARARATNLALNATRIGTDVQLRSELSGTRLAVLHLGNTVAVIASLGLLVPWAIVRTARYRAGTVALQGGGDLDDVLARTAAGVGAAGEEVAELFDFDFGF